LSPLFTSRRALVADIWPVLNGVSRIHSQVAQNR